MKKLLALAVASVFAVSLPSLVAADNSTKKDEAKVQKAAGPSESKDMKGPLYTVSCGDPCDFAVSGHDKKEVIEIVVTHAKSHHNMTLSEKDAEGMVKVTGASK